MGNRHFAKSIDACGGQFCDDEFYQRIADPAVSHCANFFTGQFLPAGYPGPADDLKAHATEFKSSKGREWPKEFLYVLDPAYSMINAYGLRWDAPRETAYPSTFVLERGRVIHFAKISRSHGDRTTAADVLAELK